MNNRLRKVGIIGSGSSIASAMLADALISLDKADLVVIDEPTRAEEKFIITNPYKDLPTINHVPLKGSHPPYKRSEPKTGRNAPCPCGSGKKFKRCCAAK